MKKNLFYLCVLSLAVANFSFASEVVGTLDSSGGNTPSSPTPDGVICYQLYKPVCGQRLVNGMYQKPETFSNMCFLKGAKAKFLYNGQCVYNPDAKIPRNCKVWYDGCNVCSRSRPGGRLMCTMRACFQGPNENNPAYCQKYF